MSAEAQLLAALLLEADVVVRGRISRRNRNFGRMCSAQPSKVQNAVRDAYRAWIRDPADPALHFKPVSQTNGEFWEIRVGYGYRALCRVYPTIWLWCWFDTHEAFNKFVNRLGSWEPMMDGGRSNG